MTPARTLSYTLKWRIVWTFPSSFVAGSESESPTLPTVRVSRHAVSEIYENGICVLQDRNSTTFLGVVGSSTRVRFSKRDWKGADIGGKKCSHVFSLASKTGRRRDGAASGRSSCESATKVSETVSICCRVHVSVGRVTTNATLGERFNSRTRLAGT